MVFGEVEDVLTSTIYIFNSLGPVINFFVMLQRTVLELSEEQEIGHWSLLSFFSCHSNSPEILYSAFDWKVLAAYSAIRWSHPYTEGQFCFVSADNKPQVHACSFCHQRHLPAVAEFVTHLQHCSGLYNKAADCLSHGPDSSITLGFDYEASSCELSVCSELHASLLSLSFHLVETEQTHCLLPLYLGHFARSSSAFWSCLFWAYYI